MSKLIERHHILERLFATTREGFWLIDSAAKTLDLNPAMCAMLGLEREAVIGRSIFDFVDSENYAIFERQMQLRAEGIVGPYEISLLIADGSLLPCVNNATPIYDDDGARIGSVGLWTDVSAMKRVQRELEAARVVAEQANLAKSQFLSSMSHELRTPLNSILGFTQLLSAKTDDPLSPRQQRFTRQVLRAGDHLLGLIDQLLDLTRIESGTLELSNEVFAPSVLVEECLQMMRTQAGTFDVDLAVDELAPSYICADRMRLRQVVLNLLSNAIKYNVAEGNVWISCVELGADKVRITVRDSGVGISYDRQAEVFQAFNRLGRENSDIEGTGVGLMVTRHLVHAMGGQIGFTSTPGTGSEFWVEFERSVDVPNVTAAETLQTSASIGQFDELAGTILYIEDNPSNISLLTEIFAPFKTIELVCARDAETGLTVAAEIEPDIVIFDIHLPGMNGIEALQQLRKITTCVATPAIALTAAATPAERERGLGAGFCAYLTKPVPITELLAQLSQCLKVKGNS